MRQQTWSNLAPGSLSKAILHQYTELEMFKDLAFFFLSPLPGDSAGEAISSVTHALERVRQYNKTILDVVKNANVEAKEVAVEVLNRYRRCNEKTLELVDSLTTSTAKLQDANALYKEAAIAVQGDDPNQNRERLQMWIAKARSVQVSLHFSHKMPSSCTLSASCWSFAFYI